MEKEYPIVSFGMTEEEIEALDDPNLCRRHLKVDCMCDEPSQDKDSD